MPALEKMIKSLCDENDFLRAEVAYYKAKYFEEREMHIKSLRESIKSNEDCVAVVLTNVFKAK